MASELVPHTESLADVYSTDTSSAITPSDQQARWNALIGLFKGRHGHLPDFVARSPGRVNIIGMYGMHQV